MKENLGGCFKDFYRKKSFSSEVIFLKQFDVSEKGISSQMGFSVSGSVLYIGVQVTEWPGVDLRSVTVVRMTQPLPA